MSTTIQPTTSVHDRHIRICPTCEGVLDEDLVCPRRHSCARSFDVLDQFTGLIRSVVNGIARDPHPAPGDFVLDGFPLEGRRRVHHVAVDIVHTPSTVFLYEYPIHLPKNRRGGAE